MNVMFKAVAVSIFTCTLALSCKPQSSQQKVATSQDDVAVKELAVDGSEMLARAVIVVDKKRGCSTYPGGPRNHPSA